MASIDGSRFDITGASGSQGLLGPKSSWRAYILPRGAHAAQDSTGTLITFDSTDAASRFAANDWVQAGLSVDNIRQVSAVGGDSLSVSGAALTVSQNDRIFLIGTTQPTVTGGSATYTTPATLVRQRDDDGAALFTNSMITSNSEGLIQFWTATNFYDCIIQDGNQTNQASVIDLPLGSVGGVSATGAAIFGETVTINGALGVTGWAFFGSTVTMHAALGVTGWATFGTSVTMSDALGVTGSGAFGSTLTAVQMFTSNVPMFNVKHPTYGALGDGSTDDTAGISQAITDASATVSGGQGSVVFFPQGTYVITTPLEVPNRVILRGTHFGGTRILADPTFAGNTAMILLGTDTNSNNSRLEHIQILANSVADIGVFGINAQEGCGLYFSSVSQAVQTGVIMSAGCQQFSFKVGSISTTGDTSQAVILDGCAGMNSIEDFTFNCSGNTSDGAGCTLDNGNASMIKLSNIHIEKFETGISFGVGWRGVVDGVVGAANMVNLVGIDSANIGGILVQGARNSDFMINDQSLGDGQIAGGASKDCSFYYLSAQSASGSRATLSSMPEVPWRLHNTIQKMGTSNTNLPEAATLVLPDGYFFGVSSTGTSISDMTQATGREVTLWAAAGTFGFSESNTLSVMGSSISGINITEGQAVKGFCTGTTWFIFAPSF